MVQQPLCKTLVSPPAFVWILIEYTAGGRDKIVGVFKTGELAEDHLKEQLGANMPERISGRDVTRWITGYGEGYELERYEVF